MDAATARTTIAQALAEIAPEIELDDLDPAAPFAEEADLDSMDLLSLAEAIHQATGVDVDQVGLPASWSLTDLVAAVASGPADGGGP